MYANIIMKLFVEPAEAGDGEIKNIGSYLNQSELVSFKSILISKVPELPLDLSQQLLASLFT